MYDREAYVKGLRDLADFLEDNEGCALPNDTFNIYNFGEEENVELAKRYAKLFGTFERSQGEYTLSLTKRFGDLKLRAVFNRNDVYSCRNRGRGRVSPKEAISGS